MLVKKLKLIFIIGLFGLGLAACGDSDTGSSDKAQSMTQGAMSEMGDGALEAYDPDVPSMVVEDNGVIGEEEIYNNWPE